LELLLELLMHAVAIRRTQKRFKTKRSWRGCAALPSWRSKGRMSPVPAGRGWDWKVGMACLSPRFF